LLAAATLAAPNVRTEPFTLAPVVFEPAAIGLISRRVQSLVRSKQTAPEPCTPTVPPSDGCDMHGRKCTICGPPLPGRGYDGRAVYSSTIHASGSNLPKKPDYVMRDDCGQQQVAADPTSDVPLAAYVHNTTAGSGYGAYPGYTNAWCDLNMQTVAANGMATHDHFLQAKSLHNPPGFAFDFWYCKHNGFFGVGARRAAAAGFEPLSRYARAFCAERATQFDLGSISLTWFEEVYQPGIYSQDNMPTEYQAHALGAWLCAMGGTNGRAGAHSDGCAADIAYCTYTYGDLDSTYPGEFCTYDECDGFDWDAGMPVSLYASASRGHTPPMNLTQLHNILAPSTPPRKTKGQ